MTDKKDNPLEEPVEIDVTGQQDSSAVGEPADSEGSGEVEAGNSELDALAEAQLELAKHRDAMLRIQAESDNMRKRMQRDLERSRKFALEGVMKDLLQVHDSLERGLDVDADSVSVQQLIEGQQLTLKMLGKVLEDHHLESVDPSGEHFNPEFHEAMTVLPSADHEENTVIEVLQKGFKLHDRLIRPARVVVSRKP